MLQHLNSILSKYPLSCTLGKAPVDIFNKSCPAKTIWYDDSDQDIKIYVSFEDINEVEKVLFEYNYFFKGGLTFYQCQPGQETPFKPYCILIEDMLTALGDSLSNIKMNLVDFSEENWKEDEIKFIRNENPNEITLVIHSVDYEKVCSLLNNEYSFRKMCNDYEKCITIVKRLI